MEILKSGPSTPDGVQYALNYAQDDMGEEWVDRVGSYENEGRGPFGPRLVWLELLMVFTARLKPCPDTFRSSE
jgi:hypothetical protein